MTTNSSSHEPPAADHAIGEAPEHVHRWLYERLVAAARAGEVLSYSDIGPELKLDFENPADRNRIGVLLGEISSYEYSQGRPLLSSVVWHKDFSGPGVGLRNLGIELGIVRGDEDDLAFGTRQLKDTHAYWANH
jgi:hypothetical protein